MPISAADLAAAIDGMAVAEPTNKLELPEPLALACRRWADHYSSDAPDGTVSDITCSQLADPPQKVALQRRARGKLPWDVSDMLWAVLGTAFHEFVHKYSREAENVVAAEQRLFALVNGWNLSGAFDLLERQGDDLVLWDYKLVTLWSFIRGPKPEYVAQLNVYRWLCEVNGGPTPNKLRLCGVWRDWSASKASREKPGGNYPLHPVGIVEVPLWSLTQTHAWIAGRITRHQEAQQALDNGDPLPPCTKDETWGGQRCALYCSAQPVCPQMDGGR